MNKKYIAVVVKLSERMPICEISRESQGKTHDQHSRPHQRNNDTLKADLAQKRSEDM